MTYEQITELSVRLQVAGLTLTELLQVERLGGSVTESHMKPILIQWGRKLDLAVNGQAPDHLQRLQDLELTGKNPEGESQIDITEMALGVPNPNRLRMNPKMLLQAA